MNPVRNTIVIYYAYALKSKKNGRLYIEYTDNLWKCFKEHNDGK